MFNRENIFSTHVSDDAAGVRDLSDYTDEEIREHMDMVASMRSIDLNKTVQHINIHEIDDGEEAEKIRKKKSVNKPRKRHKH